ncbi:MAG: hypothetical protein ACREFO_13925 [Acetobacteraceae bacterium]
MSPHLPLLAVALVLAFAPLAQAAHPDAAAAKQAIDAATLLETKAASLDDVWSASAAALSDAKKALADENYTSAVAEADRAATLARLSIAQATAENELWRNVVPH